VRYLRLQLKSPSKCYDNSCAQILSRGSAPRNRYARVREGLPVVAAVLVYPTRGTDVGVLRRRRCMPHRGLARPPRHCSWHSFWSSPIASGTRARAGPACDLLPRLSPRRATSHHVTSRSAVSFVCSIRVRFPV